MTQRIRNRPPTKAILKMIKGCLEVVAICDTNPGLHQDNPVAKGTIGYVLGHRADRYLVCWPTLLESLTSNPLIGSHPTTDFRPTGKRG